MSTPAYRIVTPRLELRAYDPTQAEALRTAVLDSLDRLLPWMPWAHAEPQPVDQKIELLRRFRGQFDLGEEYGYAIFDRADGVLVGGTGLRPRIGPGALEIGYWIRTGRQGKGYATESTAALTRVAFLLHGVLRVEIHCDPRNDASAAVPRRLGFAHEATLPERTAFGESEMRDEMIWTMYRRGLATSEADRVPIEAFDAAGRPIARVNGAARA